MLASYVPEEAEAAAEDDWASDSKGQETLSREAFMDAIFELADMWTKTIDPHEYVEFLGTLFGRLAKQDADGFYFWRELHEVEYGGYQQVRDGR